MVHSSNDQGDSLVSRLRSFGYKDFVVKHYLPLSFAVAIIWALAWPVPGKFLVEITILGDIRIIQEVNMIIVFFISGLVLKTEDLKKAWAHKLGVVYGFVAIVLVTPMLGYMFNQIPLVPKEFAIGLTIFSVVPTTLGIGVALVRSCKGNEGLALFLTVGTNLLGVFTMPLLLKLLLHNVSGISVKIDIVQLFVRLTITILVPSVAGKVLREAFTPVQKFAQTYRTALSIANTSSLAMIVWQNLSGAQHVLLKQAFVSVLYVILLAVGQHLLYLAINYVIICYILRMSYPEAVATAVMSSQKSAPVAVTVISNIAKSTATVGLLVIPCVVGQIAQIFIGAALAPFLAKQVVAWKEAQQAAQEDQEAVAGAKQLQPAATAARDASAVADSRQ